MRARPFQRHEAIKPQLPTRTNVACQGQNVPDFKSSSKIWHLSLGGKKWQDVFPVPLSSHSVKKSTFTYFCVISQFFADSLVS